MRLERILVRRTPGIDRPFTVEGLSPDLNLVLGPNGSGKTSLVRAIRAALWPREHEVGGLEVELEWRSAAGTSRIEYGSGGSCWSTGTGRLEAPPVPSPQLAHCLLLELSALDAGGQPEQELAREIRRQLAGGFDLEPLRAACAPRPQLGRNEEGQLRKAQENRAELERRALDLAQEERRLDELDRELEEARSAAHELELVRAAVELAEQRETLRALEAQLGRAPAALAKMRGDEAERSARARADEEALGERLRDLARRRSDADERVRACEIAGGPVERGALEQAHAGIEELRRLEQELGKAEDDRHGRLKLFDREWEAAVAALPGGIPVSLENAAPEKLEKLLRLLRERAEDGLERNLRTRSLWLYVLGMALVLVGVALLVQGLHAVPVGASVSAVVAGLVAFHFARVPAVPRREAFGLHPERVEAIEDELRDQASEVDKLDALLERLRERARSGLEAVGGLLRPRMGVSPSDAASAAHALRALEERSRRLREALASAADLAQQERVAREELQASRARGAAFFAELDLQEGDEVGLARLVEASLVWKQDGEERRRLQRRVAELEERLEARTDLLALGAAQARERRELAERRSGRLEELSREQGRIDQELADALRDRSLEGAIEAELAARRALHERREEALAGRAEAFLLEEVARERDETSTPALLRRARDLFAAFTRGRYEVELARADGRLAARDTLRARRVELGELSGATRAQLLLAARLAFLQESEGEQRLPIVLDEALATSDAERFGEVAKALLRQSDADGRQLFYLGARDDEIPRWRAACSELGLPEPRLIDLAAARGAGAAIRDPSRLRAPLRRLPPPTLAAAEYGAEIGVPCPDAFAPIESWHLFHLLRDDLALLRRLQGQGVDCLGPWWALTAGGRAGSRNAWATEAEVARLDAWAAVVHSFLEHWRVGRSRPLERRDLEVCPAISEVFLDKVAELCAALGGDSVALVRELRQRAVKGFYGRKADELEEYLRSADRYDDRERAGEEAIAIAVLRDVHDFASRGLLSGEAVRARVAYLWSLVGGSGPETAPLGPARDVPLGAGLRAPGETEPDSVPSGPR